jgi:hypothetical protein
VACDPEAAYKTAAFALLRTGSTSFPMTGYGKRKRACALIVCTATLLAGAAQAAEPRAVVELFTSQGCSSCPPADKLLGDLAQDPSVIALTLPIDYWDYLGWKDTLADSRFTARQKAYSHVRGDRDVYTPQVVVNGTTPVIGSDHAQIDHAIATRAGSDKTMPVPVSIVQTGKHITVSVAPSKTSSATPHAEVWICSVTSSIPIAIGRGENRGREVTYHNVVRNWLKVGDWSGAPATWTVPVENVVRDGVDAAVVLVQNGSHDRPGAMLGAAMTSLK